MHLEPSLAEDVTCNDVPTILKFSDSTRTQAGLDYLDPVLDLQCITKIDMARLRPRIQTEILRHLSKHRNPTLQTTMTTGAELLGAVGPQAHRVDGRPFPGLRKLVLNGLEDDLLKAATDSVRSRSDRGEEGEAVEGRARLEQIEFVGEDDETIQHGEYPLAIDPNELRWNLHLELFEALSDDAKVFWGGMRISKIGVMD